MNLSDIFLHVANFVAPALALALLLPLLGRLFMSRRAALAPWWVQVLLNFVLGGLVLAAALWWLGNDGKMLSYGLLVLAVGTSQWVMMRGWRH